MTDPTRLIDEPGGDELEASLLRMARDEGPSAEGRRRILAGIAAAGATGVGASTAEAAAKVGGKGLSALKWGLLGVAAVAVPAALLVGGSDEPGPAKLASPPSALQVPASEVASPTPPAGANAPAPVSLDDLPALPTPAQPSGAAARPAGSSLAEEVAQLQKAKLALKAGNPGQALTELNTYAQKFPKPMLGAEATVVRIEALHQSGDAVRAKLVAESYLAKNPNSPYATRLRNLTGAK
jgi:hypothetical protein